MSHKRTCGHCGGTGMVDLPESLSATLAHIPATGATAPGITGSPTTINNRLAELQALGLVRRKKRRGYGRAGLGYLWEKTHAR